VVPVAVAVVVLVAVPVTVAEVAVAVVVMLVAVPVTMVEVTVVVVVTVVEVAVAVVVVLVAVPDTVVEVVVRGARQVSRHALPPLVPDAAVVVATPAPALLCPMSVSQQLSSATYRAVTVKNEPPTSLSSVTAVLLSTPSTLQSSLVQPGQHRHSPVPTLHTPCPPGALHWFGQTPPSPRFIDVSARKFDPQHCRSAWKSLSS
jgi:hypothetical protein